MLTIVKSPPEYNLAKSPMMCELSVNNLWYTSNMGDKAHCSYNWTGLPVVSDTFTITWASGSVTFTFDTVLDTINHLKIRTNVGALSYTAYTAQVVADILTNPTIAGLFDVTSDYYTVFIKAKNAGATYTFSNGNGTVYTDFYNLKNGTDNIVNLQHPNYGIMVDIFLFDDFLASTYKNIYTTFKKFTSTAPVANCQLEFDIAQIINAHLEYDFPDPGTSLAFMCDKVLRRFFLRYREFWGEPPSHQFNGIGPTSKLNLVDWTPGLGYTITGHVLKAGFSQKKSRLINNQQFGNYYFPVGGHQTLFLTRQPRVKKIKRHQPEYLYMVTPYDIVSDMLCLHVKAYDKLGNYISGTLQSISTPAPTKYMTWCYPVNFPGSFIQSDNSAVYKVFVAKASVPNTPISETFTYYIDDTYSAEEKILLFTNSDGGVDTITLRGEVSKNTDYAKEDYNTDFALSNSVVIGEMQVTEAKENENYTVNTGFISIGEKEWLRDIFLAKTVVEWDNKNETYIPVVINTKKLQVYKTAQNLHFISFDYSHAFNQSVNDSLNYL